MGRWNKIDWPVEKMRRWYEVDGLSVTEIGKLLDKNPKLVWKVCNKHGFQMRPVGPPSGSKNPAWKGGQTKDKDGYVLELAPLHPMANSNGYVRKHRLIAELLLGRLLTPTEVVHHKDDDPGNNDPDNLYVYETNAQHLADTLIGKIPAWTEDGKRRIAAGVEKRAAQLRGKPRPKHWKPASVPLPWPDVMVEWYVQCNLTVRQIGELLDRSYRAVAAELHRRQVSIRAERRRIPTVVTDLIRLQAAQLEPKYRGNPKRDALKSQ